MGLKPHDSQAIPLCPFHHTLGHMGLTKRIKNPELLIIEYLTEFLRAEGY
jgi:hypothetical protein